MGGARFGQEAFAQDGYLLLPALLNPAVTDFLWSYVQTKLACRLLGFGHGPSAHVLSAYGDPAFDGLLEYLRPRFEEASGLQLSSTFSFSDCTSAATNWSGIGIGQHAKSPLA